jgi:replicative DNA helicase
MSSSGLDGFSDFDAPKPEAPPAPGTPQFAPRPAAPAPASGRIPPHDRDAEAAVLGSCLLEKAAIEISEPLLKADDFYIPGHRDVWACITELNAENRAVDVVTVQALLAARGRLEVVGGPMALLELMDKVASTSNVEAYARLVRERSQLRRMLVALHTSTLDIYDRQEHASAVIDATSDRVLAVTEARTIDFELIGAGWQDDFDMLRASSTGTAPMGMPSGLASLDRLLGGIVPKKTMVIGGKTGEGKSTLAINLADNLTRAGIPAAFFSLEMDKLMIRNRIVAARAEIDGFAIERGRMSNLELEKYHAIMTALGKQPLHLFYEPQLQLQQFLALARVAVSRLGCKAIFIDYMQLLDDDSRRYATDAAKLSFICRRIAQFGRTHKVAIIEAAMLKRDEGPRTKDLPPRLADLKESGGLEENADVVLLLHTAEEDKKHRSSSMNIPVSCHIAKHRGGDTGQIELTLTARYLKFGSFT